MPPSRRRSAPARARDTLRQCPPATPVGVLALLDYLRGVELVGELVEDASARLGHGKEPFERDGLHPGKVGAGGEHAANGGAVAAQGDPLDLSLPGREQARRFGGRLLDELAFLPFTATAEAVGRGAPVRWRPLTKREPTLEVTSRSPSKVPTA